MARIFKIVIFAVFSLSSAAGAQPYAQLLEEFHARPLVYEDKRFLQAALAFEGSYLGLWDGDWGKNSQSAMRKWTYREFNESPSNYHAALLAFSLAQRMESDGWDMRYLPENRQSLVWPYTTITVDPPSDHFLNFRHSRSSLSMSYGRLPQKTASSIHDYTGDQHQSSSDLYTVRKTNFAVTSARKADGSTLYTRSDFVDGAWSTIMLYAGPKDANILNAVAGSITLGRTGALRLAKSGWLDGSVLALKRPPAENNNSVASTSSPSTPPAAPPAGGDSTASNASSGSGFVVSAAGHILTNAHVVEGCRRFTVDGSPAMLLASSEQYDLALLQSPEAASRPVATFSAASAKLNSDVTAVGFPYAGLLGGLNVTRGTVSSLKGMGGDLVTMQISAPVQSGNSGGPLLAADGEVVGVVVAKLDAVKVADLMGDLPQNVNFAIRGEIATLFLSQNGVEPKLSLDDSPLSPEMLARQAQGFTTFIECGH